MNAHDSPHPLAASTEALAGPATLRLADIAHARSGDKGGHANVGVIAYTAAGYAFLRQALTGAVVAEFFAGLQPSRVERLNCPVFEP